MGRKRCIELTESEQITRREGIKYHSKHEFRRCCQALLWSAKGWSVNAIAPELEVCQVSVSSWLTNWQNQGLVDWMRQKGQGCRTILSVNNTAH